MTHRRTRSPGEGSAQRWAVNPKHSQGRRMTHMGAAINAAAVRHAEEEVAELAGKL